LRQETYITRRPESLERLFFLSGDPGP
jgi:hypothetical protein